MLIFLGNVSFVVAVIFTKDMFIPFIVLNITQIFMFTYNRFYALSDSKKSYLKSYLVIISIILISFSVSTTKYILGKQDQAIIIIGICSIVVIAYDIYFSKRAK